MVPATPIEQLDRRGGRAGRGEISSVRTIGEALSIRVVTLDHSDDRATPDVVQHDRAPEVPDREDSPRGVEGEVTDVVPGGIGVEGATETVHDTTGRGIPHGHGGPGLGDPVLDDRDEAVPAGQAPAIRAPGELAGYSLVRRERAHEGACAHVPNADAPVEIGARGELPAVWAKRDRGDVLDVLEGLHHPQHVGLDGSRGA
jgi:hypothetical protein